LQYELSPIVVSVYTRLNHLKRCIGALQKNLLAEKSELFVYSDASSRVEDDDLVKEVREYLHNIEGFKKIHIIERNKNYGGVQNASQAHREVTEKYGKSIFMEDDIVTAPGFLIFMNEAFEFYQDNDRIVSISGYCPPISIPNDYKKDVYLLPRFNGWGVGLTWENLKKYNIPIDRDEYIIIKKNKKYILEVGGSDIPRMIQMEVEGKLDAGDVRIMYQQGVHSRYTLYPSKSLTQNIGHDGTGVHCGVSNKFHHEELWDKTDNFIFIKDIEADMRIVKSNSKFRSAGLRGKIVHLTKKIGLFPALKKLKDKI
jgi:hypothetical protein